MEFTDANHNGHLESEESEINLHYTLHPPISLLGCVRPKNLPVLGIAVMTFTISLCFLLTYSFGHEPDGRLPAISQTGMYMPERVVFTAGFLPGSGILVYCTWIFWKMMSARLPPRPGLEVKICCFYLYSNTVNNLVLLSGLISSAGLFILGAVSLREFNMLHQGGAAVFFMFAVIQASLAAQLLNTANTHSRKADMRARFWLRWKVASVVAALVFAIVMPFVASFIYILREGEDAIYSDGLASLMAVRQYLLVLSLLVYIYSLRYDFSCLSFER